MGLISLEKFLYGPRASAAQPDESPGPGGASNQTAYFELLGVILRSVATSVLEGEGFADLREKVAVLRSGLEASANPALLAQTGEHFAGLMGLFRERSTVSDRERAEELRKILTFLNEALVHLTSHGKRSDSRLKSLETSLLQAASTNDLRTLKMHLSQMVTFIRAEAASEGQQSETAINRMTSQIQEVRQSAGRHGASPRGKADAVAALQALFRSPAEGNSYLAVYTVDTARAMRARYGHETVQCLLDELAVKRVQPTAPEGQLFYWSPESILLLFRSPDAPSTIKERIAAHSNSPFSYQAFLGSRIATLNVNTRWVVMPVESSADEMIWAIDKFTSGARPC